MSDTPRASEEERLDGWTSHEVVVEARIRRVVTVFATSPRKAASLAEQDMAIDYPDAKVEARQVDYWTEEGGESHYYPITTS